MITCFVKTPFSSNRYEFSIEGLSEYINKILTKHVVTQQEIQEVFPVLQDPIFLDIFHPDSVFESFITKEANSLRYLIGYAEDEVEMTCYGPEKEILSLYFNLTLFQESLVPLS